MKQDQYGDLTATLAGGTDREGGGDGPVVVLMHGFGAPGTDLVPLWRQLDVPHEVRFVFPEAPHDLGELADLPAYAGTRAWWMIDVEALERAARGEARADRSNEVPEGLPEARASAISMLDAVEARLGVSSDRIVLGGFSQGSMLALDVALHTDRPLGGLVLMSSTLIARADWEPRLGARRGLPVLQSHGRTDPLLPFTTAETLRDMLRQAGLDVRWIEFNGGHTITDGVLEGMSRFIQDVLTPS